jgi:hypothetical protein
MNQVNLSDASAGARPTVSIIIPCYNGEQYIGRAIESCLALNYPDVEIIVVDDGSRDRSLEVIGRYHGVKCISQVNQGQAVARNNGLAASTGEFLIFLDHDDEMMPDAIGLGLECLRKHPGVSFVFGHAQVIGPDGNLLSEPPASERQEQSLTYPEAFHVRLPIPPSLALFRGDVVRRVGGFDTSMRYSEDFDFFLRVLHEAPSWRHGNTVVRYRRHGSNMSRQKAYCLEAVLSILDAQAPLVRGNSALEAELVAGKRTCARFFGSMIPGEIVKSMRAGDFRRAGAATRIFFRRAPFTLQGALARLFPERADRPGLTASTLGQVSTRLG